MRSRQVSRARSYYATDGLRPITLRNVENIVFIVVTGVDVGHFRRT